MSTSSPSVPATPEAYAPVSVLDLPASLLAAVRACDGERATVHRSELPLRPGPVSSTGTGSRGLAFGGTSPDPNPITY